MSTKILVIDDSSMIRRQVGRALTSAGFVVVEAADGLEGLDKLAANPDTHVVLCDITMPRMNGIDFLEHVRKAGYTVPVLVFTTEGEPDLVQRAKALGAKGWIVKPFREDLIVAAIKKIARAA
jgi:two-component system chemotaxis response regulator CheY